MKKLLVVFGLIFVLAFSANAVTFYYSTDLGSDLDLSDPITPGNNWMDCGDIYVESAPTLVKNDDTPGPNSGFPYVSAPQPTPAQVGNSSVEDYPNFFDLDAEDQIEYQFSWSGEPGVITIPEDPTPGGIHFEPEHIYISYEDDGAPGWAVTGDVPTTVAPDNATEVFYDYGLFWSGAPNASWSPPSLQGVRDEVALGLAPNPLPRENDDDVDALDIEQWDYWYFSPDHEAHMGDDPGSIYLTIQSLPGQNKVQVIDDAYVGTGFAFGIPQDTDVDAFEFVAIGEPTYQSIFGFPPNGYMPPGYILCGLFSVDEDDPDTGGSTDFAGNESGGLNPNTVYISDFLGNVVPMATYDYDVDAITVDTQPLPIELQDFHGEITPNGVELHWTTATELNNAGFNVYKNGQKMNVSLIPGAGTATTANTYSFLDQDIVKGKLYTYQLSDIEAQTGVETFHPEIAIIAGQGMVDPNQGAPAHYALSKNYPNPFNPTTNFTIELPNAVSLQLKIYDSNGRLVRTFADGEVWDGGIYPIVWDGTNDGGDTVNTGIYFYTMTTENYSETKPMILLK